MSKTRRSKKLFHSPISFNLNKLDGTINLDCITYNSEGYKRTFGTGWKKIESLLSTESQKSVWLNLYPLENKETIEKIEKHFDINPFLMADAVDFTLRPKTWFTERHLFCSFKMLKPNHEVSEHISFILGGNILISLQEDKEDVFNHIRDRLENNYGLIRKKGVDYMFFLLCDALIDQYTLISDQNEEELQKLETEVHTASDKSQLQKIHLLKKALSLTHKDIRATNDVLTSLTEIPFPLISDFVRNLFISIRHNSGYSLDSYSHQTEQTKNLSDLYFAQQNNKLNEMIKLLTILSAIFIPISFVAGFYGMNFVNIPELEIKWAYPAVISFMLIIVITILFYFKKKRWL
ncbi:magnesium/cobalt transporter CorA [Bacteroidia bacterium]|nr:magnesium/cobalt transporter CorA [Bacteroidia bacterium]MDB9881974.1 magnesium/cobalt transporter CorA [Bacteroidia bacterium]